MTTEPEPLPALNQAVNSALVEILHQLEELKRRVAWLEEKLGASVDRPSRSSYRAP
jgi:hypothetical protein